MIPAHALLSRCSAFCSASCSAFALLAVACVACVASVGCSAEVGDGSGVDPAEMVRADQDALSSGYTYVQYCNVPNSSVGTRCIWTTGVGPHLCDAAFECERETRQICGGPTATWVLTTSTSGSGGIDMNATLNMCRN